MSPIPNSPPATTPRQRLQEAQQELARLRAGIKRSSSWTTIIGLLIIAVLGVYFYIGNKLWAEFSEPEKLVNLAQTTLDDYLPEAKKALEREVLRSAPRWSAELSKELVANVPEARKKLQQLVIEELDKKIRETHFVTDEEIRKFLRKDRKMMEARLQELAKDPKAAERSMQALFTGMEDNLGYDLKTDAALLLKGLKAANRNWSDMLLPEKDLTEDQKLERRVWMVGRLIYLRAFEPNLIEKFRSQPKMPAGKKSGAKKNPPAPKEESKKPKEAGKPKRSGRVSPAGLPLPLRHRLEAGRITILPELFSNRHQAAAPVMARAGRSADRADQGSS